MFSKVLIISISTLLLSAQQVYGHGKILAAKGATNGVSTQGFGINTAVPLDCSGAGECESDTSIIRDQEIARGGSSCGRTQGGGQVDIQSELNNAISNGLADVGSDGTVTMTLHQVNQDGAGPYTCDVDTTGTGNNFQAMTVTQNVPGKDLPVIGSLSTARATDFTLVAQMPSGATCSGTGGACLVRCRNAAIAGPFGGCVAVTNAGSNSNASNSTASNSTASNSTAKRSEDEFLVRKNEHKKRLVKIRNSLRNAVPVA